MPDIKINPADFEHAIALKNAITRVLSGTKLDLQKLDMNADLDMSSIASSILSLDSSEEIQEALFKCLDRCTYDGERINKTTFDSLESREHYYKVMVECIKVNLTPFFKGLISQFKDLNIAGLLPTDTQKSK